MSSRLMDYVIILLVGMFMCITFINFSFPRKFFSLIKESDVDSNPDIAKTLSVINIIEMTILCLFLIEIALKSFAYGVKTYFNDKWLLFDLVVIVLSTIMLILD